MQRSALNASTIDTNLVKHKLIKCYKLNTIDKKENQSRLSDQQKSCQSFDNYISCIHAVFFFDTRFSAAYAVKKSLLSGSVQLNSNFCICNIYFFQ